jgi:hypothetical protein
MPDPANVQITCPPGFFHNGTIYQSKGRWRQGSLVRFQQDQIKPVGGWQMRNPAESAYVGMARALFTWRDNSKNNWIGVGTSSHLYAQAEDGTNHDITPTGYVAGRDDATRNLGYGGGFFGESGYGSPPPATSAFLPATVWTLDNFGENLVGVADSDGKLYQWPPVVGTSAALVSAAPTGNVSLVVTQEGMVMVLGAGGDPSRVAWCDQQDITDWTPTTANQAGDFDITSNTLRCAITVRGGVLIFTDIGVWQATYLGAPLIYGFERVGQGCGVISIGGVASRDSEAVWMGKNGAFWLFDGQTVQPLDCDVLDYLANYNLNQESKISAVHLADQGEIWWLYPSAASVEVDSYVCWAYRESQRLGRNIWTFGALERTCGENRGILSTPLMVDTSGYLWEHETGVNWGGATPWIETGPFEVAQGDFMAEVQRVVPDQVTDGQLSAEFFCRMWPNGPETLVPPIALVSPTDLLFQATEIRTRYSGLGDWRLGNVRLDIIQGDMADSATPLGLFVLDESALDGTDVLT